MKAKIIIFIAEIAGKTRTSLLTGQIYIDEMMRLSMSVVPGFCKFSIINAIVIAYHSFYNWILFNTENFGYYNSVST